MNFDNFDKQFARAQTTAVVGGIVSAVLSLALLGGVIAVAWHFVSKFW